MDDNEIAAFKVMICKSRKEHLLNEVVDKFFEFLERGDTIIDACNCALYEWDI